MKKTEFEIKGKCVVKLEHEAGSATSKVASVDFNLELSNNLIRSQYLDNKDLPTAAGTKALTQCFVQSLIGNIHNGHQQGHWDSAEHLRYIIAELEKGFVAIADVSESYFNSK